MTKLLLIIWTIAVFSLGFGIANLPEKKDVGSKQGQEQVIKRLKANLK